MNKGKLRGFTKYLAHGFSLIPIKVGTKLPAVPWKMYQNVKATWEKVEEWDVLGHDLAIVTGSISGIIVVDVDGEIDESVNLPPTWTVKTSKGYHYYYAYPKQSDLVFKNKVRIAKNIDIRADGGYVVAPPSRNKETGIQYKWEIPPTKGTLAPLPDWIECLAFESFEPYKKIAQNNFQANSTIIGESVAELYSAMEGTRNNTLNKCAFRLAQYGLDKQEIETALLQPAIALGLSHEESIKTLSSASLAGYRQQKYKEEGLIDDERIEMWIKPAEDDLEIKSPYAEMPPHIYNGAPNWVGEIAAWINETSIYPQPILSLAASLTANGLIKAHKVKSRSNLRTNLYCVGIAGSGSGKDHARRVLVGFFTAMNMQNHLLGKPKSGASVLSSLIEADAKGLMMIDEIGRYLAQANASNASTHQKQITDNLMELFTSSSSTFLGDEYADAKRKVNLIEPCLSIYACSEPSRFFDAIKTQDSVDGFLARWLLFSSARYDIKSTIANSDNADFTIPPNIFQYASFWQNMDTRAVIGFNPMVVDFDDPDLMHDFMIESRQKVKTSGDLAYKAFWNRAAEHATKIALCGYDGGSISRDVTMWAIELASFCIDHALYLLSLHVSGSQFESETKKVLALIKKKGTRHIDVARQTQWMERRRRQEIIDSLVEAYFIRVKKIRLGGKEEVIYFLNEF